MKSIPNDFKCYIITGISGSGKTTALKAFEDLGYYCIDNIPSILIADAIKLIIKHTEIKKIAIGVDVRERTFLKKEFKPVFLNLKKKIKNLKIVYLFADDKVILNRYKETRRIHPLMEIDLKQAIEDEKKILQPIKEEAEFFIDTTFFTVNDLKKFIYENFGDSSQRIKINIISFGYKNGILIEGDLIFDVRFLPNPHFNDKLRDKDGNDPEVEKFVFNDAKSEQFYKKLLEFIKFLIPEFEREGKNILIIGIGCTGGKHRSVAVANRLFRDLSKEYTVNVKHRDI